MRSRCLLATVLAVVLVASTATHALAQQVDPATAAVDAFERARAAGDISAAIDQFADDAVITVQSGRATQVFAGRDQIRAYLMSVAMPTRALMRSAYRVDGPFVRWTERNEDPRQTFDATVQATIQSGHISTLLFQQTPPFATTTATNKVVAEQPYQAPSLAWAAALGAAFMLLLGLVFRPRRRRRSASVLDGHLLRAMRRSSWRDREAA